MSQRSPSPPQQPRATATGRVVSAESRELYITIRRAILNVIAAFDKWFGVRQDE